MRPLHGCVLAVLGAAAGLTVYRFTLGAASDVPSVATASALEVLGHAPPRAATADPSRDRCIAAYGARVSAVLLNATTTVERMLARMRTQPSATSDHPLVVLASPGSTGTRSVFKAMCVLRLKGIHYMTHCNSDQPDCAFQPLYSRTVTGANKRGRHPPDWVENGVERLFDAWGDLAVARREGTCDRWLEARGNVPFFDGPEEYVRLLLPVLCCRDYARDYATTTTATATPTHSSAPPSLPPSLPPTQILAGARAVRFRGRLAFRTVHVGYPRAVPTGKAHLHRPAGRRVGLQAGRKVPRARQDAQGRPRGVVYAGDASQHAPVAKEHSGVELV